MTAAVSGDVVTVESLAAGGDGVAHLPDGLTVFVARTAPGDTVRLGDVRRRARYATARLAEVVSPGPGRVEPACRHFTLDHCGGCQWQQVSAPAQAAAKARIVGDALRRIGGLEVADPELVASPRILGYRTTATLTVRPGPDGVIAGFHRAGAAAEVFPLDHCAIARDEVNALWSAVRPALAALPPGDDVRLKLRVAPDGGLHVLVAGGEGAWRTPGPLAEAVARAGLAATIWWQPRGGAARRMGGAPTEAGALSFEQVNAEVAGWLRAAVTEAAAPEDAGPGRILDLYAGSGETALALAGAGHAVVMVEIDPGAVRRAEARARQAGLKVRCVAGRVEDWIGRLLPADVVVVNPPRVGLGRAVADQLGARTPARLVYVSCDPATLARDLKRLGVKAQDLTVRAYDMFPQTSHVETLALAKFDPRSSVLGPPSS